MIIVVTTIVKKTMLWRVDEAFKDNLDKLTVGLAKGASMALITYLVIKVLGIAHDNEWAYLTTGWGQWFSFELLLGVITPLALFAYGIRNNKVGIIRFSALLAVIGIALNRLNTAIIAFNWNLYQEIPHIFEVIIAITLFGVYITTYRFILYRLPILYSWKKVPVEAYEKVTARGFGAGIVPQPTATSQPTTAFRDIGKPT